MLQKTEVKVGFEELAKSENQRFESFRDYTFIKEVAQSKGTGKQLLNHVKKVKSTLKLNVYKKNERAIQFYLREEFSIQSESVDDNTGEKELIMVWKR